VGEGFIPSRNMAGLLQISGGHKARPTEPKTGGFRMDTILVNV
jgi:hypothetical protein